MSKSKKEERGSFLNAGARMLTREVLAYDGERVKRGGRCNKVRGRG